MPSDQIAALRRYFNDLAEVLDANARIGGVDGHSSDTGENREALIEKFVNDHCPRRLRCHRGGRILGLGQAQSKQIDCVVVSDVVPGFLHQHRSFFVVEAVAMAISVKSHLNKGTLFDALENLASIPQLTPEAVSQTSAVRHASWVDRLINSTPALTVWSFDGIDGETTLRHTVDYYEANPAIPWNRRPRAILVNKKFAINWSSPAMELWNGSSVAPQTFHLSRTDAHPGYTLGQIVVQLSNAASWYDDQAVHFFMYLNEAYADIGKAGGVASDLT
jgi:hypothetical protein